MIEGRDIAQIRLRLGLSLGELARRLEVEPPAVFCWEKDQGRPSEAIEQKLERMWVEDPG